MHNHRHRQQCGVGQKEGEAGLGEVGKEGENGGICNSVNNESKEKIYIKEKERGEKGNWNMEQYPGVEKKECRFWESDVLHFNLAFATSSK